MVHACLNIHQSAIVNGHTACTVHIYNSSVKFSQLILPVHNKDTVTAMFLKNVCGNSGVKGRHDLYICPGYGVILDRVYKKKQFYRHKRTN
jgi:hypothetical protein